MEQLVIQIIIDVEKIVSTGSETLQQRGSYIMGATMFRDDYDDIIVFEPMIEELAESASNLEIEKNEKYAQFKYDQILYILYKIKTKYLKNQ